MPARAKYSAKTIARALAVYDRTKSTTKAAAAEMSIRINNTLARWATLTDARLEDGLTDLTGQRDSPQVSVGIAQAPAAAEQPVQELQVERRFVETGERRDGQRVPLVRQDLERAVTVVAEQAECAAGQGNWNCRVCAVITTGAPTASR